MCAPAAPPIRLPIPNPNPNPNPNPRTHPNPNPIFNRNPNNVFERKQKRHRNIGQHKVIFTGYLQRDGVGLSETHNPELEVFLIRYACAIPVTSLSKAGHDDWFIVQ